MKKRVALAYRLPALLFPLLFLVPALPPFVDYPQHVAIAAVLRRLADPTSFAARHYEANLVTYNGFFDEVTAALSVLLPVERAARLVVVAALELFVVGAFALLARQRAPRVSYLLLVPLLPSFTLFWGFTNHLLGLGIGLVFVALLLELVAAPAVRVGAAVSTAALALLLAHTHVLATIVCLMIGGAWVLDEGLRDEHDPRGVLRRVAVAALTVAPACAFCIYVHLRQFAAHASAYAVASESETDPLVHKLAWFGSRVTGALKSHADGLLVWGVLAIAAAATTLALVVSPRGGWRGPRWRVVVAPVAVMALGYVLVPGVFVGTHLVYPRLALPLAVLALGLVRVATAERLFEVAAAALAAVAFLQTGQALARFDATARDLLAVLQAAPDDAWIAPVHETAEGAFTDAYEPPVLHHVAAYHVAAHDAHVAGLFGNYASLPVRFREPEGPVKHDWLEANGGPFDGSDPYAARFHTRLVLLPRAGDELPAWASSGHELLARRGRFALVRTVEPARAKQSPPN